MRILQKVAQQARTFIHGAGKLGKQLKKFGLARNKTDHVTISWSKVGNRLLSHAKRTMRKETDHAAVGYFVETRLAASPPRRSTFRLRSVFGGGGWGGPGGFLVQPRRGPGGAAPV